MPRRLLLVGWDAADWKILQPLMRAGGLPTLETIVKEGVSGNLLCGQPPIGAAQWTSVATGKRPWQHRICHPRETFEPGPEHPPVSAAGRKALAVWEMLGGRGKRALVVGWPASHGSRGPNLQMVSDRYAEPTAAPGVRPWPPAIPGTFWPEALGSRLDRLRVSPEDLMADVISRYIPDWKKIDQKRDRRLGLLRLFVAADFSHHSAMRTLLQGNDWDLAAVRFPALGGIVSVFGPFCGPKPDWISGEEFALYQQVIPTACATLDRLLRQLIEAAGKNTAVLVVSAHGVSPQPVPPRLQGSDPEAWKSQYGILAAAGQGLATGASVFGATVLDITPTVLSWFGLPIGEDMEGRVLLEGLAAPVEVARIETWEAQPEKGREEESAPASGALQREYNWNHARFSLEAGRYEQALPILERLFRSFPERTEFGHALLQCQLQLRKLAEASETLAVVLEGLPAGIWSLLLRAEVAVAKGALNEARACVDEVQRLQPTHPDALRRLGMLLWRLRQWPKLAELARQALSRDENEPMAWLGLAEASLRQRQPAEAAEAASRAIRLNYYLAQAHFILARALLAQGKWNEAREAMQVLLRLQPANRAAAIYAKRLQRTSESESSS